MKAKVGKCTLVVRRFDAGEGVRESSLTVGSIEELYEVCLGLKDAELVERLVISGRDAEGRRRLLSFSFQSVAGRDGA